MTMFHAGSRELQDRFDSRRLADRLEDRIVSATIGPDEKATIEAADCFFLATADADGRPTCSYKGGDPGFVRVVDERTIAFPCYDGNGMFLSMGNVLVNPAVGLLFVDFERASRMRLEGDATIDGDDPLLADFPEAQFMVRVTARQVFPNCPRYIHRRALVAPSEFVPRSGCSTPVPDWKRSSLTAGGVLPAGDPANAI
jgi:hypothetical protein